MTNRLYCAVHDSDPTRPIPMPSGPVFGETPLEAELRMALLTGWDYRDLARLGFQFVPALPVPCKDGRPLRHL